MELRFLSKEKFYDDNSPASLATWYMINKIETELGMVLKMYSSCFLVVLSEMKKIIRKCYNYFKKSEISSLISCSEFSCLNPWWSFQTDRKDEANYLFPKKLEKRSQDLEKVFSISGAVWIIKNDRLKKYKTFYCPGHKFFPIDSLSALDIDTKDDLEFAKKINIK